jgi:G3E family GTPase
MSDTTYVYLITGFLGSGKTTFLNRVINQFPEDKKLTILMNEFGEIGVDGTLIEGEDLDIVELSKGSIFCVCVKTDFIKGLNELHTQVQPDVLVIESTGVANPTDLKRDLTLPIFDGRFQFQEQFCIVDCMSFLDAFEVYATLEKQITTSTVFILNKTDLSSRETIEQIKEKIRTLNSEAPFYEATYADIPVEKYIAGLKEAPEGFKQPSAKKEPSKPLNDEELEEFIENLVGDPEYQSAPSDLLVSAAYEWQGSNLEEIRETAKSLPKSLIRAKGFVLEQKGEMYIFNYVLGNWTIEKSRISKEKVQHKNVIVFIGPPDIIDEVESLDKSGTWISLGKYQPMQGNA